jgi:hypothetical protein
LAGVSHSVYPRNGPGIGANVKQVRRAFISTVAASILVSRRKANGGSKKMRLANSASLTVFAASIVGGGID